MITISPIYTPKQIWKHLSQIVRYSKTYKVVTFGNKTIIRFCKYLDITYNIDYDYLMYYYVHPCKKIYNGK